MSKKLIRIFALLMSIVLAVSVLPTAAFAAGKIATDQPVTLTINYKEEETALANAHFDLYKVANVDEYARMSLTSQFEPYKNTVQSLSELEKLDQDRWLELASTLEGYVWRDDLTEIAGGETDENGILSFSVNPGLYLVIGYLTTTDDFYSYSATPFMIFLPGLDRENNVWSDSVTVLPKFEKTLYPDNPTGRYVSRKVLKLWDDEGYETIRPEEIVVQLLRNGEIYDIVSLNAANNWRYVWDNLDSRQEWTVVEKEVPDYAVKVIRNGITFLITNRYIAPIIGTDIPVQKRIIGDIPGTKTAFTFVFSAKDASCPMPEGSSGTDKEITITGAGSANIGEISFEKPGTYAYTVIEKNGGEKGYTYDRTVYTVTYEVTEKDGALSASKMICDDHGNEVTTIEFTNNYKTPGEELPKTGMLWWPVPVLLCAGLVLVMIGILRRRRCS